MDTQFTDGQTKEMMKNNEIGDPASWTLRAAQKITVPQSEKVNLLSR